MKGLFTLTLLSATAAVNAQFVIQKRADTCGVNYAIFPQDRNDQYFRKLDQPGGALPDFTNKDTNLKGVTKRLGFAHSKNIDDQVTIYQSNFNSPWYYIINHQFYIKACYSGKFQFTTVGAQDDMTAIWVGDKAYNTFTLDNCDLKRFWGDKNGPGDATFTMNAQAGQYIPVRVVNLNGGGPGGMKVRIKGPINSSGTLGCLIEPDNDNIKDIYFTCPAGTKTPSGGQCKPFPDFPFSTLPQQEGGYGGY